MTCHFYIIPFLRQNRHLDKMLAQLDLMKTLFERAGGANRIISTRHKKSSYNVSLFLLQFCKNFISLPVSLAFSALFCVPALICNNSVAPNNLPLCNNSTSLPLSFLLSLFSLPLSLPFHFLLPWRMSAMMLSSTNSRKQQIPFPALKQ